VLVPPIETESRKYSGTTDSRARALFHVAVIQSLLKGFSVFYFLLLPILYATGEISAAQLGYVGAILIAGILIGALAVSYWLHQCKKSDLLNFSFISLLGGTIALVASDAFPVLTGAYLLIGIATGIGMSAINALAAHFTTQGDRFGALAKVAMLTDISRIFYPLAASAVFAVYGYDGLIYFAVCMVLILLAYTIAFNRKYGVSHGLSSCQNSVPMREVLRNRPFRFVVSLEFLDSFASSQLFVFLPALLVFKDYSVEHALVMQAVIFLGYLSGRLLVSQIASKFGGFLAIAVAEAGMVCCIVALLVMPGSHLLYLICFALGLFARGTAPVIKALAFDRLSPGQMQRGAAIHVLGGDGGSACGQLAFGFGLALFGVTAPFIGAAVCASAVSIACLSNHRIDGV
jgi:MFS transporter, FSR family, fosmidomycin resistance protein